MDPNDLLRVALYDTRSEAQFVLAALLENGIDAKLSVDEHSALGMDLDVHADEVELIVKRAEFDKAKEIIEDLETGEVEKVPAWTCQCGEDVDEGFDTCWSCGAGYKAG